MKEIPFQMSFPAIYGKTRFLNMEQVKKMSKERHPDAVGMYAQCRLYGVGVEKYGDSVMEDLFYSAKQGCSDAILYIGRLYEQGAGFIAKDKEIALNLYKYAYSMENADALHSLGFVLLSTKFDKKKIGLAMMRQSEMLGSKGAQFHLELIKNQIKDIEEISFYDIPQSEFDFDKIAAIQAITLYDIDLQDFDAIKDGLLDVLVELGAGTYSEVVTAFRIKYLRGREFTHFRNVPFEKLFNELKESKQIDKANVSALINPDGHGVADDTLYKAKFAVESKNFVSNNLNDILGDLGIDLD